jgi:hypothetical protein
MLRSCLVALSFGLLSVPAGSTLAGGKTPYAIFPGFCKLPDGTGKPFITSTINENIVSASEGVANLECHGTVPTTTTLPSTAALFDFTSTGAVCGTPFGTTLVWHAVVTPSGQVTLICQIKKS